MSAPVIDIGLCAMRVEQERRITELLCVPAVYLPSTDGPGVPFPSGPWHVSTAEHCIFAAGELTSDAWDAVADCLAALVDEQAVELDLVAVAHARTMPSRPAGYLRALEQRGAVVVVRCSAYVRACIQASRWGCELAVRWEVA